MRRSLPDVRIEWKVLSSTEQIRAIRQDRLDLGFVHTPIEHEGLALRAVSREPLVAVLPATHRLAGQRSIALRALKDETFVVATRDRVPATTTVSSPRATPRASNPGSTTRARRW